MMSPFTREQVVRGGTSRRWSQALAAVALGLMWLAPSGADAAILKRVHSGTVSGVPTGGTTITLELADASKAFVVCSVTMSDHIERQRASCELSNNTLYIDVGSDVTPEVVTVSWHVAEFESGVSVQRGTSSFTTSGGSSLSLTPSISTVDCTKSFVVMAGEQNRTSDSAQNNDEIYTFRGILGTFASPCAVTAGSTTSTFTIARNDAGSKAAMVSWQVVTMDGATVLARASTSISNSLTKTDTIASSDPTKAFLVWSRTGGTAIAGIEGQYLVRADFSSCSGSCTGVTFTRGGTSASANHQVDIAYEVVSLGDGGTVQRGLATNNSSNTTMGNPGNITAVDRSATVPIFGGSDLTGSNIGSTTRLDSSSWAATFPSTTQLLFSRGSTTSDPSNLNWFAVSFYKCQNSRLCSVGLKADNTGAATVSWSPIYDPQCLSGSTPTTCEAVVLRDTVSIDYVPANGTTYTAGNTPPNCPGPTGCTANLKVAFVGAGQSVSGTSMTTGLVNGTHYYYRVYPKLIGATNYITDAGWTKPISEVDVIASTNANLAWSYSTTGLSTLNAPIPGNGKVYVASNGGKLIVLDSSNGTEVVTAGVVNPVITNGALQSYLGWFPASGGSNEAVVVGDHTGWLTSINAASGARNWTVQLPVDSGGYIQAAISAQLRAYTLSPYQCDGGTFANQYTTTTQDLIYVVSRNALTPPTNNQIWAVRADYNPSTMSTPIQWTYPATAGTPAMDRATGQPYVDYCRNRLWVSTGNNASQDSLWVINTVTATATATKITSFPSVGDQTSSSPTLSWDSNTMWVGDAAGNVYAFDAATTGTVKKYSLLLTGTSPQITGFIWEDWYTAGRLYIPVRVGSPAQAGVWCVQDNGSTLAACSDWATNPRIPYTNGTLAQPTVMDTAIFFPASDGKIYQINTTDGTLKDGTGRPFTVESGTALGGLSTEDWTQLYVGTSTGRSYRINLSSGNLP